MWAGGTGRRVRGCCSNPGEGCSENLEARLKGVTGESAKRAGLRAPRKGMKTPNCLGREGEEELRDSQESGMALWVLVGKLPPQLLPKEEVRNWDGRQEIVSSVLDVPSLTGLREFQAEVCCGQ